MSSYFRTKALLPSSKVTKVRIIKQSFSKSSIPPFPVADTLCSLPRQQALGGLGTSGSDLKWNGYGSSRDAEVQNTAS